MRGRYSFSLGEKVRMRASPNLKGHCASLSDLSSDVLPQMAAAASLTLLTAAFSNPLTTADLEAMKGAVRGL